MCTDEVVNPAVHQISHDMARPWITRKPHARNCTYKVNLRIDVQKS